MSCRLIRSSARCRRLPLSMPPGLFAPGADRPCGIEQSGDADRLERRAASSACRRDRRERLSPEYHGNRHRRIPGRQRSSYRAGTGFTSNSSLNGAVSAVSLQWLLFDFGERAAVVDAAKQGSVISNIAFTAVHQQLIYSVTLAFYNYAAAQARSRHRDASLKNAQDVQAAADDRYKHGFGTVTEVAQARQGTAQANLAVVQATGGAQDAYLALITAMGISPLTKIRIANVSGRKLSPSMAAPVERIISNALARRPDVQSAYAAKKASLANVRAAQAEFMPKFFLSATGTYNSGNLGRDKSSVRMVSNRRRSSSRSPRRPRTGLPVTLKLNRPGV